MKLEQWCRDTYVRASIPKLNYPAAYAKFDAQIRQAISEFSGVKTDLFYDFSEKAIQDLRVSLILSDFTSVFPCGGIPEMTEIGSETEYAPKSAKLTQPFAEMLQQHEGKFIVKPAYFYRNDNQAQDFISQIDSLADSGRLMIRPTPIILGLQKNLNHEGRRVWNVAGVEPSMPGEIWFVRESSETQNTIPLKDGNPNSNIEISKCSFMLPYLEGLSFQELALILDDENDLLTEFRKSIRDMLAEVRNEPDSTTDIVNDIVRPATDKIQRKFKTITNARRIKVAGGTVGAVVLVLTALTTAGVSAVLTSILGAGGLGFIAKEYADYLKDKDSLRDMPLYLLWRLKREHGK